MPGEACQWVLDAEGGVVDEIDPQPCGEPAQYRAQSSLALYRHLCWEHWDELRPEVQALYEYDAGGFVS